MIFKAEDSFKSAITLGRKHAILTQADSYGNQDRMLEAINMYKQASYIKTFKMNQKHAKI